MAITAFPGPPDLTVPYEQMITDGININVNPYTVDSPHPGFGKDPNILNEYGHTEYPMWEDNPNKDSPEKRIIVTSKADYEELVKAEEVRLAKIEADRIEAEKAAELAKQQSANSVPAEAPAAWPK